MSSTIPRKRASSSSLPNPSKSKSQRTILPMQTLETQLSLFTRSALQILLLNLATDHPIVATAIEKEAAAIKKVMAQAPAINFQPYSSRVWHLLNVKYARLRPSQQFEVVGEVVGEIESAVNEGILSKVKKEVCYDTKYNALSVLRKIAKSILLTEPGEIAKGVQNHGALDTVADAMKDVVEMMDEEERKKVLWGEENLVDKLEELDELRDVYMEGLGEVLEMFGVGTSGDNEDENENEDEDGAEEEDDDSLFVTPLPRPVTTGKASIPKRIEVIDLTS